MCKNNKYILRVRPFTILHHLSNHSGEVGGWYSQTRNIEMLLKFLKNIRRVLCHKHCEKTRKL